MKIGVSACLLGTRCRYDGVGAKSDFVLHHLSEHFELVAYCPEDAIWGSPRQTIRLEERGDALRVIANQTQEDFTTKLQDMSETMARDMAKQELCGFVLKSKSPSCGLERVKVYQESSYLNEKRGTGIFAQAIKAHYPYLPLEEEGRLEDAWLRENFLMQVYAYKALHEFLQKEPTQGDLVAFHTDYKYLLYSKSHSVYKALGNIVANHDNKPLEELLECYKEAFLSAIAKKSTINNTYNVLVHIYGYFKNSITKEEKAHILQTLLEFKDKLIPLIAVIKLFMLYIQKYDIAYIKRQTFMNPYPKELALRSDIKAYK